MNTMHPMKIIVENQKKGIPTGIYSACTANSFVIEAVMERALKDNEYALIEATANQVNQYGGNTGMSKKELRKSNFLLIRFYLEEII